MSPNVWQIAAGETGRRYPELFVNHDVMFIGPGDAGEFDYATYRQQYRDRYGDGASADIISQIRSFHAEVRPGDFVLLRERLEVTALGVVAEDGYSWQSVFDDVYGWDLQHTRRVIWQDQVAAELRQLQAGRALFAGRKQIPTFTRVRDKAVIDRLSGVLTQCRQRPLRPMPNDSPPLTAEQLGEELFAKGLPNESVDDLLSAIARQRRLSMWYDRFGEASGRPTEHEVVAHMVLPMLLALGWSEQLLAVEWNRIDLAAFAATPTTAANCALICEAKGIGRGMQDVCEQAKRYAAKHSLDNCRRILLTEGARFYLYERAGGKWGDAPCGYLNIRKVRKSHVAPRGTNAVDTIVDLTPAGVARSGVA